jgi:capsid assembly protease
MHSRHEEILAIEPEAYRRWAAEVQGHPWDVGKLCEARSPEAALKLAPARKSVGDIAVVNVSGFITQKPSIFTLLFGGTATEDLVATVRAAMAEPSIGAVVLSVDSPGGVVFGVPEAAAALRGLRGPKPFIAVSNPFAASAAYYLAAQADDVVALPSSMTGSIGVIVVHVDESKALEREGLVVTEITHGKRKAEGSSLKPLSDDARESIQRRVDYYGALFEADVAKGRGVSPATVRAKYGEGAVFTAGDALAAGLVDRVATMDEVLGRLATGGRAGARMEADPAELGALAALAGVKLEEGR